MKERIDFPVLRERDYEAVMAREVRLPEVPPPEKRKGRYHYSTWEEDEGRENPV